MCSICILVLACIEVIFGQKCEKIFKIFFEISRTFDAKCLYVVLYGFLTTFRSEG